MVDLPSLRRKYGPVFVTTLDSGDIIPWKQLNIGEYLEYTILMAGPTYAKETLEDEIFNKCVLDEYIVNILPALKAGTVSTVVKDIIEHSGPGSIQELNTTLNVFRSVASQAIHQTVVLVAQAFPGYKLEDIYEMKYPDFMLRLAQAELKLLQLGVLEEQVYFQDPEVPNEAPKSEDKLGPIEMYTKYLENQKENSPSTQQTIIKNVDAKSLEMEMTGHEKEDSVIQDKQMLDDASLIYKDYLEQMSSGKKFEIKTPEERIAAAEKRAQENKQSFTNQAERIKKSEEVLEEKYAQVLKRAAAKKR